ncbi:PP0621 family protein [Glaciimonas soli]|uniref:Deaminase n=1 Tax=Glaciimonas soli TaxID=2590999 RepID=A0A843YYD4_9BURK|nr:PP0621 family protein [Glaciimonas soli]MQR02192.1 hypothetical protein [Glaciimonas soli]
MKFVILLIIVLAVLVWFQRLKKNLVERARQATQAAEQYRRNAEAAAAANSSGATGQASVGGASPQVETMVACAHCGLHFPASEAVTDHSGAIFCSEEHRRLQVAERTRAP